MSTSYTTRFVPTVHGFQFPNHFVLNIGDIRFWGRCNGMSWVALDYFNAGRSAPRIREVDFDLRGYFGPGAAASADGIVQLFAVKDGPTNPRVVGCTLAPHTLSAWSSCVTGDCMATPTAAVWPSGKTHLLIMLPGGVIGRYEQRGNLSSHSTFSSDISPEITVLSTLVRAKPDLAPAIAAPFEGRLEVYAIGNDDQTLQFCYLEGGRWHDWASLGKPPGVEIASSPAAVSAYGFMSAFVRGSDNKIWQRAWANGDWQPWVSLDGEMTAGPAACLVWPGRFHVFGRGTDGALWMRTFDGHWDDWTKLPAAPVALEAEAPAAVGGRGFLQVFARAGSDIWRLRWDGGWQAWEKAQNPITAESRRLTDAILERNMAGTIRPLISATALVGAGLPFLGSLRNYVTWRSPSDDDCFRWSSTDELRKLIGFLRQGRPMPLGLIAYSGWGHEVVAHGLETDLDLPPGSYEDRLPAGHAWRIKVYDPNHPGSDNVTITLDPNATDIVEIGRPKRIFSSTGESWRGVFVRDDYQPAPPPV